MEKLKVDNIKEKQFKSMVEFFLLNKTASRKIQ